MKAVVTTALFAVSSMICGASFASAAAFSIADLQVGAKLATDKFETDQAAHVEHFVGYKAWKSGEEMKVKIYVNHNGMNMEFNYYCHKHDDGIECHDETH